MRSRLNRARFSFEIRCMTNINGSCFSSLYVFMTQRLPDLVLTFHIWRYKYPQFNLLPTDATSNTITAVSKSKSQCLPEALHIIIQFYLYFGRSYNLKTTAVIKLHQLNVFKNHLSSFLSQLLASAELGTWTFTGFITVGSKIT